MSADGRSANLMLAPHQQELECITVPDAFAPVSNDWGRRGATTVELGAVSVGELTAALELAWQRARPKPRARKARNYRA